MGEIETDHLPLLQLQEKEGGTINNSHSTNNNTTNRSSSFINVAKDVHTFATANGTEAGSTVDPMAMYVMPTIPTVVSSLYLALIIVTLAIGIPGNTIVTAAYFKVKNKSTCDWYILFIAVLDLLSCDFRVTGYLLEYLDLWAIYTNSSYCKFMTWISQTTVCMGNLMFALIALDRYAKICAHRRLSISSKQSRNLCLIMIVVTLVLAGPTLHIFDNVSRGTCSVKANFVQSKWVAGYYTTMFLLFLAMMIIVVFCYACIFAQIRRSRRIFQQPQDDGFPGQSYTSRRTVSKGLVTNSTHTDGRENSNSTISTVQGTLTWRADSLGNGALTRTTTHFQEGVHYLPQASETSVSTRVNVSTVQEMKHTRRERRDNRITGLLFLVTIVFIVSWIPPYAAMIKGFYIGYSFPMNTDEYIMLMYAPTTFMINNFANPLIYVCLSSKFRQNVRALSTGCRSRCR